MTSMMTYRIKMISVNKKLDKEQCKRMIKDKTKNHHVRNYFIVKCVKLGDVVIIFIYFINLIFQVIHFINSNMVALSSTSHTSTSTRWGLCHLLKTHYGGCGAWGTFMSGLASFSQVIMWQYSESGVFGGKNLAQACRLKVHLCQARTYINLSWVYDRHLNFLSISIGTSYHLSIRSVTSRYCFCLYY